MAPSAGRNSLKKDILFPLNLIKKIFMRATTCVITRLVSVERRLNIREIE